MQIKHLCPDFMQAHRVRSRVSNFPVAWGVDKRVGQFFGSRIVVILAGDDNDAAHSLKEFSVMFSPLAVIVKSGLVKRDGSH